MQKSPIFVLAILFALYLPIERAQSQEHDYLIYWDGEGVAIRLRVESEEEIYSKALNKKVYHYEIKVQKRDSQEKWQDLKLCQQTEGFVFNLGCSERIKRNTVKITSEIEIRYELEERFVSDTEQLWRLSRFLNRHVLSDAPNYESYSQRPSAEGNFLRTQYYVFSYESELKKYLARPAEVQKNRDEASPKSYPLRISLLGDKDHDFDELKEIGKNAYTIRVNNVPFRKQKSVGQNTISFLEYEVISGKAITIKLEGAGFKRLKANELLSIPYKDWRKFIDKGVITLSTKKLEGFLRKKYSLYFEDLPLDLATELSNISIDGIRSRPQSSLNQKGKGLTFVDLYYDQGRREIVFSFDNNETFFDYEDWHDWIVGNSIRVPWKRLNEEGLFDRRYSFEADSELTNELSKKSISMAGVRIEGPWDTSETLNFSFDFDRNSAIARIKLPYSSGYVLKFPENRYFNGGAIKSKDLLDVSGKYQLSLNKLASVLNGHEWVHFESTEGESLPKDWPHLFFRSNFSSSSAFTEVIKDRLKTDLYNFKKVGSKVKVTRKSFVVPLDYSCDLRLGSWISEIDVMDRDFINYSKNFGYSLLPVPDNNTKVPLKATKLYQIELRFRPKTEQRGLKYPANMNRDTKGEYFSIYWYKNANKLEAIPCPEKLKPMEVVFFDAILGRDLTLFRTKIKEIEDRHRNGEIAGFQLIFGYADDLIVELYSDQVDFKARLQDQFGRGDQEVHLLRNYADIPIPYETISLHVNDLEKTPRYENYIIHKKAYLTRSSQINMTSEDESMLKAANVDVEYFKNK